MDSHESLNNENEYRSSEKKNNNSSVKIFGFVILCIFIFAVIFAFGTSKEDKNETKIEEEKVKTIERDITYVKLMCLNETKVDNYSLRTDITNNYRDGVLQNLEIKYSYYKRSESSDNKVPTFPQVEKMKKIDAAGVIKGNIENGYIVSADFEHYELRNVEELKDYTYVVGAEYDYLTSIGFYCSSESKVVKETVYVDTNEKVK